MSRNIKIRSAEMLTAAARASQFPPPGAPEVAFLGRSNVGKSSLLNRLVARKQLARTSSTPGKTRLVHWYAVERTAGAPVWLVDLPGYGYAKVSKSEREKWKDLVESYLGDRPTLRAAVLLQDLRREVSEDETLLLEWLAERRVPSLLAITKTDKLKPMRRKQAIESLRQSVDLPRGRILPTSAQTSAGIPELWQAIDAELRSEPSETG
jgi:GTP-binding protein